MEAQKRQHIESQTICRDEKGIACISVRKDATNTVYAQVDDSEYFNLVGQRWFFNSGGYAMNKDLVLMHHLICHYGKEGRVTDHIDGNKLNNQRSNLRVASKSLNARNVKRKRECTSQYRGVHYNKRHKKFVARIQIDGRSLHIGDFEKEEDAAQAYQAAYDRIVMLDAKSIEDI